ncbi:putative 26S proteasome non-ATPase regulatory subunit 3 [Hibiscus syriacus]|uniref:26S proteasome non-ATPase regulatory subunit 3 n=1 Tax=Hibiscus syriacus TaxID=106335 RepID=A0A6A3AGJ4_HIBSY|nr:putative 26S proteasome non-ATPase regulatory subunit 3 [Hibiscus syriacus]
MNQDSPVMEDCDTDDNYTEASFFSDLVDIVFRITHEVRHKPRVKRLTYGLRGKLSAAMLYILLDFVLKPADSEAFSRLSSYLPVIMKTRIHDSDADSDTSDDRLPTKHLMAELEISCSLLVLYILIEDEQYNERINRRNIDILASRLYFYYSYSYELTNDLAEIRGNLLALYCTATRYHEELSQETLLNLLLYNYLHYNLYDQADMFRSKAPRFEARSNQQVDDVLFFCMFNLSIRLKICRYLFYLGKIGTIKLQYTDAKENLLEASHKAPVAAQGFRIQCNKWAILVRLLLGEIPERSIFVQKGMEKALRPYFELTNASVAVRIGNLELFRSVAEKFTSTFITDKTQNLIVRLRDIVIRTGLRNISISYSCISLADFAKKLRLNSKTAVADVESIVAKAIRDGSIDAKLDHANGGWCRERLVTFILQMSLQLPSNPGLLSALTCTIKQFGPCLFHHTGSGLL